MKFLRTLTILIPLIILQANFICARLILKDSNEADSLKSAERFFKRGERLYDRSNDRKHLLLKAEQNFTSAILLNPNRSGYYIFRAWTREDLKNYWGAIEDFKTYLNLRPDSKGFSEREILFAYLNLLGEDSTEDEFIKSECCKYGEIAERHGYRLMACQPDIYYRELCDCDKR